MKSFIVVFIAAAAVSLAGPAFGQAQQPEDRPGQPGMSPHAQQGQQGMGQQQEQGMAYGQSQQAQSERLQQMIERDLVQAGLSRERARSEAGKLARELDQVQQDFTSRLSDIQQRYASVLTSGSTSEPQAQQQAQQLVRQVAQIPPQQLASRSGSPSQSEAQSRQQQQAQEAQQRGQQAQQAALPGGAGSSEMSADQKQRIEQQLRDAGVDAQRIDQLSRQGFPKEDTRQAIMTSMVEKAEKEAEQVVEQIEQAGGGQP